MGGFECATHIRRDKRRLDLLASTRHDTRTKADYALLGEAGIRTVRDGLRWHRIEAVPGVYDWSGFLSMLRSAHETGIEVIWDLCHWGVPDWLDPFSPDFSRNFERYARAAAEVIANERRHAGIHSTVYICPINEISFWAWAGGEVAYMGPLVQRRGPELKRQLVHAAICATRAVREILPDVRFVQPEPLIHIAPGSRRQSTLTAVQAYNAAQFEVWDMIAGRMAPELGGSEDLLDVLGVNYYWNNQWVHNAERAPLGHPAHEPLHQLLVQVYERYQRPIMLSETGAEGEAALGWLGMVCSEIRRAGALGVPVCGMCLYPISDYSGWDDSRHVHTGLLALDRRYQHRSLRLELVEELHLQGQLLLSALPAVNLT